MDYSKFQDRKYLSKGKRKITKVDMTGTTVIFPSCYDIIRPGDVLKDREIGVTWKAVVREGNKGLFLTPVRSDHGPFVGLDGCGMTFMKMKYVCNRSGKTIERF